MAVTHTWFSNLQVFLFPFAFMLVVCSGDVRQYTRLVGKECRPPGINTMTAKIDGTLRTHRHRHRHRDRDTDRDRDRDTRTHIHIHTLSLFLSLFLTHL